MKSNTGRWFPHLDWNMVYIFQWDHKAAPSQCENTDHNYKSAKRKSHQTTSWSSPCSLVRSHEVSVFAVNDSLSCYWHTGGKTYHVWSNRMPLFRMVFMRTKSCTWKKRSYKTLSILLFCLCKHFLFFLFSTCRKYSKQNTGSFYSSIFNKT